MALKHGVDDMVMLTKITEDSIVDNLKKRYDHDIIYTYIGHVLIAINPYKNIETLYTERLLKDYRGKYLYELPPHVYAIADSMYRSMLSEGENQCVIISGESGAGKTVTSKHILQFIAAVSGHNPEVKRVKDIILESNPLLEAFGNAKTIRNNNSSRFGKYMEIQFDLKGDPEGGRITNYLLEKSRIVYQASGERNFHIFYQILTGADANTRRELNLQDPGHYHYLNQSQCYTVEGTDDIQEFQDTMKAMDVVGINAHEKKEIVRLCAAILALGNITFTPQNGSADASEIKDNQSAEVFAQLFQTKISNVRQALLFRTIQTGEAGRSKRVSTYACPQNVEQAEYSRDALAKALYSHLFDWIIHKVNQGLSVNDPDAFSIGVLDIYGFEIFKKNGFEQLCINYVNERLQQIFIQLTLKAEQEEYAAEGIPWENIDYFNNKICCDLIDSKKNPIGILTQLDDVCNFPKGTDEKFLQQLGDSFKEHAHFTMAGQQNEFTVKHYAGDVSYNVDGFCDKNKDLLFNDLIELTQCTSSTFVPTLFPEAANMNDKKRPTTCGFKIKEKQSIQVLVDTLSQCRPNYIRCIKPNEKKQRNFFDNELTTHQVRYLGLLENVRVRRAGFAYRQFYDKFYFRYRVCCDETWPKWNGDHQGACDAILRSMQLEAKEVAKGKTKIFIRSPETVFALEELRERKVQSYANRIQTFFMRFALRRYFWELESSANNAIMGKKERRRLSFERPFACDYINYRENHELKRIVEDNGREKILFADNVTKYDRRSRRQRRVFLITEVALYIIAIEKNKDKEGKKKKPFIYVCKRRILISSVKSVMLSTLQDNFMNIIVPGEHDNLIECRRKTELLAVLLKKCSGLSLSVTDSFAISIKGGKKREIKFAIAADGGGGKMKGKKVVVSQGMPKDSKPNLVEPKQVETHTILPNSTPIQRKNPNNRPNPSPSPSPSPSYSSPAPSPSSSPFARNVPAPSPVIKSAVPSNSARGGPGPQRLSARGNNNVAPPVRGGNQRGSLTRGSPLASGGASPGGAQITAKALYDFDAENPDELNFSENDIIVVLEKVEKEWWKGKCNGKIGLFPCAYVEVVDSKPAAGGRGAGAPGRGAPRGGVPPPRGGAPRGRGFN